MCGIIGYVGRRQALPILMDGLKRLEYRGYDSAGIALVSSEGFWLRKSVGKIAALSEKLNINSNSSTYGIAHTRWATHGEPNEVNCHPHLSDDGTIALVHNGIIENDGTLKAWLTDRGVSYAGENDSAILALLIGYMYHGDLTEAVRQALLMVDGTYGIAVESTAQPGLIVAARKGSPLVIGQGIGEYFVASDASAIIGHTNKLVYLEDGEIASITPDTNSITTLNNERVDARIVEVNLTLDMIEKEGYDHFMLKEIFEQPEAIIRTLAGRVRSGVHSVHLRCLENGFPESMPRIDSIKILACGTSWHAGLIAAILMERILRITVTCEQASEFRYRDPFLPPNTLCIAISQSGETEDTKAGLKLAKEMGAYTFGIVNVVGSSIARMVDGGIYMHAGPEIGVASTKSFTCQVVALSILNLGLSKFMDERQPLPNGQPRISDADFDKIVDELLELPANVKRVINQVYPMVRTDRCPTGLYAKFLTCLRWLGFPIPHVLSQPQGIVQKIARIFWRLPNFLFLGRGYLYASAFEAALKMKEISYIHAEGYSAAEMKHGPIALIDTNMPVVIIAPQDVEKSLTYEKIVSNAKEVAARHGRIIAVVSTGDTEIRRLAEWVIEIPKTVGHLTPILIMIVLQLLAYEVAVLKGFDPDKPRNLAKSVTVE
ncbi:MAG: glutamine--fructose-6-phosphate transaminase (isomerizing) [Patescibacteria group bacterium]